jgi:2-aminoadipate transaminase
MHQFEFASGCTNPETFPVEALARAATAAISDVGQAFVRYPGDLGHEGLREVMAQRESDREGIDLSPDCIALTNGSMQAVTLIAEALMKGKDDVVVTEELTYSGTIGAYRRLGIEMVGVPLDEHGMRVDHLRTTLQRLHDQGTPPRFIYTLATYQNPTGSVMPRARRLELIDVAHQFDCIVVEDNCYGDVHYGGDKEPALYALDDSPNQLYISSLSKILGPGVRMGYFMARAPLMTRILDRRFDGGNSLLAASILAQFFRDNLWEHCARTNAALMEKRDAVVAELERGVGDICTWSHPAGGLFVWLTFPESVDRRRLAEMAAARQVRYAAGSNFHVRNADIPSLRLAFGLPSLQAIRKGIPLLCQCIRQLAS